MGSAVIKFSLEIYKQPAEFFCPIGYADWEKVLDPEAELKLDERSFAIHLWNERWRAAGRDKNARYPDGCLYEQLKSVHRLHRFHRFS
jgi:hypothetical protein